MEGGADWTRVKKILKRRRKCFLLTFLGLVFSVFLVCLILPNAYISTAVILIENQQIPSNIVASTVTSFAEERIQTITQEVMSRTKILNLIEKYDLLPEKRAHWTTEDLVDAIRQRITIQPINAEINTESQSRPVFLTIAFTLSYEDEHPRKAQSVVNEISAYYMEKNLQSREKNARGTTRFLEEQLKQVKEEIEGLENRIAQYRELHLEELPEFTTLNMQRLEKWNFEISNAGQQIRALAEQEAMLKGRLALLSPHTYSEESGRVLSSEERLQQVDLERAQLLSKYSSEHPVVQAKERERTLLKGAGSAGGGDRVHELEQRLADLKARYSDEHPSVKSLRRELDEVRQSGRSRGGTGRSGGRQARKSVNPAYVTIQSDLEKVSVSLAAAREEKARVEKERDRVQLLLQNAPGVAKEYNDMTTDYQIAKNHYNEIRQKLMAAQIAQGMEEEQMGESFKIIESAFLPEKPAKPDRILIMIIGAILSLAAASGLSAFREFHDKTVHDRDALTHATGLRVIASIPRIISPSELKRARMKRVLAGSATAFGLAAVVLFLHLFVMDMYIVAAKIERLIRYKFFV